MSDEKRLVLIADDEPDAIEMVRLLLEEDYQVIGMPHGLKIVEVAKLRRPDLIILDVQMPKKDGFATLYDLRQDPETKAIPVIFVTGVSDRVGIRFTADSVEEYMGERPQAFLEKPIDPQHLIDTVRRLTG